MSGRPYRMFVGGCMVIGAVIAVVVQKQQEKKS
jgi:hypothetical protein